MRLLIILLIFYLCYRAIKSKLFTPPSHGEYSNRPVDNGQLEKIDDIMVKDPYCEVYFPQRKGIHLRHAGQDLYFCCQECCDKYKAEHSNSN
ncbi:MAG: hypothetical protein K9L30_08000 [Desulfobacterales bacterium]|nr:hypothetical protein [Desulfobacterales bacterium]